MKEIIKNKKIVFYLEKCNIIGIILCLFSFLFTYYYFEFLDKNILNLSFIFFEAGLSVSIGALISALILSKKI